ncbi:Leucine rich repeat N-terminal domain [Musa troglodytarum]|uniref:non-specific serine/threonine protein kinase n=1 Tax=Musa troglodytarum TaxID=320322 RepID=A0A9E7L6Z1_9LILI|nr:Leucine rich repeat N-terminal domain [Musa troglodytarum]
MQLLFLLVLCLLGGGTATPEEELQILSQFRASLTAATSRTFESWDAGSSARWRLRRDILRVPLPPSLSLVPLPWLELLSGTVSADLRNCTALRRLDLAANNLAGPFPDLAPLSELRVLNLSGNTLTGAFPWGSLARLTGLQVLNLGDNSFDPSPFPKEVVSLTKLNWVFLLLQYPRRYPALDWELDRARRSRACRQFPHRRNPPEFARLSSSGCWSFTTTRSPEESRPELRSLTNLVSLQLFTNDLSGEVPPEFGEFRYLTNLSLYTNRLNGTLPPTLGSRANFDFIDVSTNFFTGGIPPDMCKRGTMTRLLILENNFTGEIPANYGSCLSLVRFRVSKNSLSGVVPAGLWGLPNLNIIDLAVNQFEGGIGAGIGKAKSLYQLYLNKNRFSGLLPPEIGGVTSIVNIDVSYNRFYGEIPASIGELKQLLSLNFESNAFSGTIPNAIGSCVRLSSVGLAANNLSGPIPASLGHLTSLNSLDLSNNQLSGEIPELCRNSGLCAEGGRANSVRSLRQCPATTKGSSDELRVVLTCFLAGAAVILACFGLYIALRKRLADGRGGHHAVVKDPSWDLKSFRILTFDEQEIVDAIKPDNLIGKGGSGEVYRVELASGEVVAVKHIWNDPVGGTKERSTTAMLGARRRPARREFEAEVATLSAVRHVNVVKLYCSITSEESCLLVYEHLPNGSLWDRLHGPSGGKASELGWDERYEIAVGAARGLEYLHHGWDRPILHRDVKSSNILLDQCFKPRIADFGLAKVLQSTASGAGGGKEGSSAHVIAGTYGYIAPEYAYTWKVNEKGDVYSFGVVLMELMTGRRPIDPEYGENKNIVHWASRRMGNRESVMAMVDLRIPEWAREEAVKVLRIAVLCTARLPATRPSMRAVVQMLEEAGRCRAFSGAVGGGKVEKVESEAAETRTVTRAPWPPPSFSFFAARCPLPGAPRRLSTSAAVAAGEAPSRTAGVESEEEKAGVVSMKGVKISGRTLYLDKQATTPIDPRVDAMLPFYLARFGNPHS